LRKRWHILTLLSVATPVLASASIVGIAETKEGSYTVVRGENETVSARAQTPVLLNSSDRVATRDTEVRIRLINGSAVVLREGEVSFPSPDVIRVHNGEAAVSFPEGSESVVEAGDYRFLPSEAAPGHASSLVVANRNDEAVAVRSLRGQFAVKDADNTAVARIQSVNPASSMLVASGSYGFAGSDFATNSATSRPDFFYATRPAPTFNSADPISTTTTTVASQPAPTANTVVASTAAPTVNPTRGFTPSPQGDEEVGTSVLFPGSTIQPTITLRDDLTTYDLEQPTTSFVTEPGDRPPRPRR
jgi:hypothetical protein